MTLDKYIKKKPLMLFLSKSKKQKIFHVNVYFRCSHINQKLGVLFLAYMEIKFRIS